MAARKKAPQRRPGSRARKDRPEKKDSPTKKMAKKALARAQAEILQLRLLDQHGRLTQKKLEANLKEIDDNLAVMVHMIRFFL
jgi:signal recognition particle GTPase